MSKTAARDRYHRVKLAGAGTLNRQDWQEIVDAAIAASDAVSPLRYAFRDDPPPMTPPAPRPVWLEYGQMVVDSRRILEVEAALAEAEELHLEIRQIASEDMNSARRDRLLRTLEAAKAKIARRLNTEPS